MAHDANTGAATCWNYEMRHKPRCNWTMGLAPKRKRSCCGKLPPLAAWCLGNPHPARHNVELLVSERSSGIAHGQTHNARQRNPITPFDLACDKLGGSIIRDMCSNTRETLLDKGPWAFFTTPTADV